MKLLFGCSSISPLVSAVSVHGFSYFTIFVSICYCHHPICHLKGKCLKCYSNQLPCPAPPCPLGLRLEMARVCSPGPILAPHSSTLSFPQIQSSQAAGISPDASSPGSRLIERLRVESKAWLRSRVERKASDRPGRAEFPKDHDIPLV